MGTKRTVFVDEEAKRKYDPDSDVPVLGNGATSDWDLLGDPGASGFAVAEAPGDGDLDVVDVRKSRGTKDWEADEGSPRPTTGVQVPETDGDLAVTIQESNVRARDVPGFSGAGSLGGHSAEHTVHYAVDLDADVATFVAHETPDRPDTGLAIRLALRARNLADRQVRERERFRLDDEASAIDDREVRLDVSQDRGL